MKKALLYLFAFICIQYLVSWAVFAVWLLAAGHSSSDVLAVLNGQKLELITAPMQILSCAVYSALTLALFVWRKWAVLSPAYLRSGKWGIFFWSGIASLGTLLPSVWLQSLMPDLANTSEETFRQLMSSQYGYFVLCLLVPFVEETVFRGAILKSLLGSFSRPWVAILISAAVFAVIHLNPAQMPHAFLIGLLLGWMYYRTGSILPGVAVHWVNNTVVYVLCTLFPHIASMSSLDGLFGGNQKSVVLSLIFSMFIFLPAIYQLNMRMKK